MYNVYKEGGKWCVRNTETNKKMGEHDTHAEAVEQMKALYANMPEHEKEMMKK